MNETGARKRILVVDDDEIQALFAQAILDMEYDVTCVTSGSEALRLVSTGQVPDLVLLDVLMPGMDGFETYDRMRRLGPMKDLPILFLTSVKGTEEARRALKKGAADYITKPYVVENFTNRIKNALQVYEYKRRAAASAARPPKGTARTS